jgi:hypothetical protein
MPFKGRGIECWKHVKSLKWQRLLQLEQACCIHEVPSFITELFIAQPKQD